MTTFKKCKLTIREMKAMRDEGYSYAKIADACGVSKQRVFQLIGGIHHKTPRLLTETECVYPNLRKYMNENKISRMSLARQIYGEVTSRHYERLNKFLNGTTYVYINKHMLDRILSITGLTYEQLFANN